MNKVLFVATHPDDETLGCGGTILRHKAQGDSISWLIVTGMQEKNGFKPEQIRKRRDEIRLVSAAYGFKEVVQLGLPTTKLDEVPKRLVVNNIADAIKKVKPGVIYLPFKADVHSDHRVVFDAVYSSCKSFRSAYVKKMLMMEVVSETEFAPSIEECAFNPNYFMDISKYLDKKLKILKIFKSEIRNHPFPRSLRNVRALATFRGAQAGCKYAEAFVLLKEIE
jgi:N-acetylglucosamine malate deacetylase 1